MDNIRIAVLSAYDDVRAFLDNAAPEAMHYYDDELHEYLKGAASTYTFKTDAQHPESVNLVEGNKLAFKWRRKDYYFNIVRVIRDEYEVEVEAYSLNLELLNERADAYKASKAMKFAEYLDVFDFEKVLTLNINEVADKTITHEWTGSDTVLARIYSLATVFDAEAEFVPQLNNDYSLKRIVLNVYKKNSSTDQGMGRYRQDIILRYGKEVSGITKTSDITELYTAIRPTGKDGLMITSLNKTENDSAGNVEYQSLAGDGCIRAVQARDRFPSNTASTDRYSTVDWSYDTDNVNTLYGQALAELKKNCVPQVQYEVEGYFDTDIGDTVTIVDEVYNPPLYLQARGTEQSRSFTDPGQNKTIFDNFKELQSQIDKTLLNAMQKLINESKVYTCSILTDNGIVFKNGEGSTTLTASVMEGGADKTGQVTIQWYKDGTAVRTGVSLLVNAADISSKAVYRYEALEGTKVRGTCEVTVSNVTDGAEGTGIQSITEEYYLSTSKESPSGGSWVTTPPTWSAGKYMWTRKKTVYKNPESTVYTTPLCDSSWEAVNEIEIGVRNLFRQSGRWKVLPDIKYWISNGGGITLDDTVQYDGYSTLKTTVGAGIAGYNKDWIELDTDSIYTFSALIMSDKTSNNDALHPVHCQCSDNKNNNPSVGVEVISYKQDITEVNKWTLLYLTFRPKGKYWRPFVNISPSSTSIFNIAYLKLETGNKATDWSPALEDIQDQIDDAAGIAVSDTEPTIKYTGMLWKHTGTVSGLVKDTTYRWNGTKWELFEFSAVNIKADTFTGYEFNGSVFKSSFRNWPDENGLYVTGDFRIEGGEITTHSMSHTSPDGGGESIIDTKVGYNGITIKRTYAGTPYKVTVNDLGVSVSDSSIGSSVYIANGKLTFEKGSKRVSLDVDTLDSLNSNLQSVDITEQFLFQNGASGTLICYMQAGKVYISGDINFPDSYKTDAAFLFATVDSGYRPRANFHFFDAHRGYSSVTGTSCRGTIERITGYMRAYCPDGSTGGYRFSTVYDL